MAEYGIKQMFGDKVTDTSTTAQNGLGVIRFEGEKQYRYVQVVDMAAALGDSLCAASTGEGVVTIDRAGGSQLALLTRGVAIGAIASGSYGWIQTKGVATINCDGTVAAGDAVIPSAVTNGVADVCDDSTVSTNTAFQVFGFALTADSGTTNGTATAYISCP